jgi:seryl-tRNA synthetase
MHDLKLVRERLDDLREAMRRREAMEALGPQLDRCEGLDRDRRQLIQAVEERKAARNAGSQEVARRKRAGELADDLIAHGRALGEEIAGMEQKLAEVEGELASILLEVPNITAPDVPAGDESNNVIVRTWGEPRASTGVKPHWEIAAAQGLFDLERAAKVSGSGFVVFRRDGARLVRALLGFFLDSHTRDHGYEEIWPFW